MNRLPVLAILNPTCLDIIESQRQWLQNQGVQVLADPACRKFSAAQIQDVLRQANAVVLPAAVRTVPSEPDMADAKQLKVCAIAASGFEWFDLEAATRQGIVVTYAPGGMGAQVVAELAWGLILAATRQIVFHHNLLSRGDETRGMGVAVSGKTLGIVGLGAIGREVAVRAKGFQMRLMAHDPFAQPSVGAELGVELTSLERLLQVSDIITLHVRLNEETRGMIAERQLRMMKPSAFLINAARKELIDERALVNALLEGRLGGAGLDDPPSEAGKQLFGLPNVVFTPHLGNRALEGTIAVFRSAVQSAVEVLQGQKPNSVLNPSVYDRLR